MRQIGIILLFVTLSMVGKSQIKRINYCECKAANTLKSVTEYSDSIFASLSLDSSMYVIKISNTTTDTFFLFSTYLQQQFFNSKYLHRVNTNSKLYKISFIPIIPFVFTKYADAVATNNTIIGNHQVVYDFIKMQPNSYYEFSIPVKDAFDSDNVIKDFATKELNKFDYKTRFKSISAKKSAIKNYKRFFEFAIYKDVSVLCKESNYYLNETEFNTQAKSFTILQVVR